MNYEEALEKFGEYYRDRYTKEFPMIMNMCGFFNRTVLEIGAGKEGYFPIKFQNIIKDYMATDVSKAALMDLQEKIPDIKIKTCNAEKLPFGNGSYDAVLARWSLQEVTNLDKAVDEMCRVAKEAVVIVLPSEDGMQTELRILFELDKYEQRKQRVERIKSMLERNGLKVEIKKLVLNFIFPDLKELVEILNWTEYRGKLSMEDKLKVRDFLKKHEHDWGVHFTQGAAFICGKR